MRPSGGSRRKMDTGDIVRIIAGVLGIILVVVIILRRKKKAQKEDW